MKKIRIRIGDFIKKYNFNEPQDVLDQLLLDLPLPPYMWCENYSLAGDDTIEVSELIDEYIGAVPYVDEKPYPNGEYTVKYGEEPGWSEHTVYAGCKNMVEDKNPGTTNNSL